MKVGGLFPLVLPVVDAAVTFTFPEGFGPVVVAGGAAGRTGALCVAVDGATLGGGGGAFWVIELSG